MTEYKRFLAYCVSMFGEVFYKGKILDIGTGKNKIYFDDDVEYKCVGCNCDNFYGTYDVIISSECVVDVNMDLIISALNESGILVLVYPRDSNLLKNYNLTSLFGYHATYNGSDGNYFVGIKHPINYDLFYAVPYIKEPGLLKQKSIPMVVVGADKDQKDQKEKRRNDRQKKELDQKKKEVDKKKNDKKKKELVKRKKELDKKKKNIRKIF